MINFTKREWISYELPNLTPTDANCKNWIKWRKTPENGEITKNEQNNVKKPFKAKPKISSQRINQYPAIKE